MAGVLIYTAAPDSEGTLGGLVSLGKPETLERHLDQALDNMRLRAMLVCSLQKRRANAAISTSTERCWSRRLNAVTSHSSSDSHGR